MIFILTDINKHVVASNVSYTGLFLAFLFSATHRSYGANKYTYPSTCNITRKSNQLTFVKRLDSPKTFKETCFIFDEKSFESAKVFETRLS